MSGVPRKDVTWSRVAPSALQLQGTRVAVVGGTGGLGRAIARVLAARGAHVTVVGQTFRDEGVEGLHFIKADLSLMHEAQRVSTLLGAETLDVLLFTTGIFATPKREETPEGIERDLAVSYLNRLALLRAVAPKLGRERTNQAAKPRVFVMGFPGTDQKGNPDDLNAEKSYAAMPVHMTTVAGNEALVLDAVQRYPTLNVYGLNPGLIKTNIRSNVLGGSGSLRHRLVEGVIGLLTMSAEKYADTIAPLLVSSDLEKHSGVSFNQKGVPIQSSPSLDAAYVARFISASEALLERALSRGSTRKAS